MERELQLGTLWCPKEEALLCLCPCHLLFPELLWVRAVNSPLLCHTIEVFSSTDPLAFSISLNFRVQIGVILFNC